MSSRSAWRAVRRSSSPSPRPGKCVYDIEGEFADNYGTSIPGFDLCKDPTLKFAE